MLLHFLTLPFWLFIFSILGMGLCLVVLPKATCPIENEMAERGHPGASFRLEWLFMSPLFGLLFVASLSHFFHAVLFWTFSFARVFWSSLIFSLVCFLFAWRNFQTGNRFLKLKSMRLWFGAGNLLRGLQLKALPVFFLLAWGWAFWPQGFHLLNGGQDELQYVMNARQMLNAAHTQSAADTVVPRADHWLSDFVTRDLTYNQVYRRGAEYLLAFVSAGMRVDPSEAFSVVAFIAISTLVFSLTALLRVVLQWSASSVIWMQALLLSAGYFSQLLLQGSLANLCSVAFYANLWIGASSLRTFPKESSQNPNQSVDQGINWRSSLFLGLMAAGCALFYSELSLVLCLFPLAGLFGFQYWQSSRGRQSSSEVQKQAKPIAPLNTLFVFFVATIVVAHQSLVASFFATFGHLAMFSQSASLHKLGDSGQSIEIFKTLAQFPAGSILGPIWGLYSHYQQSFWNGRIAQFVGAFFGQNGWLFLLVQFGVILWAVQHGFKKRNYILSSILLLLLFLAVSFVLGGDALRFSRTAGYVMPLLFVCFARIMNFEKEKRFQYFGVGIALVVLGLNLRTSVMNLAHIHDFDEKTDPIYHRLRLQDEHWKRIRDRIGDSLLLITGFQNTVEPHWLVTGLEPVRHILGSDIQKFWKLMLSADQNAYALPHSFFGIKGPDAELPSNRRFGELAQTFVKLAQESDFAISPHSLEHPIDWETSGQSDKERVLQRVFPFYREALVRKMDLIWHTNPYLVSVGKGWDRCTRDSSEGASCSIENDMSMEVRIPNCLQVRTTLGPRSQEAVGQVNPEQDFQNSVNLSLKGAGEIISKQETTSKQEVVLIGRIKGSGVVQLQFSNPKKYPVQIRKVNFETCP